jgi:hypothetical protein
MTAEPGRTDADSLEGRMGAEEGQTDADGLKRAEATMRVLIRIFLVLNFALACVFVASLLHVI